MGLDAIIAQAAAAKAFTAAVVAAATPAKAVNWMLDTAVTAPRSFMFRAEPASPLVISPILPLTSTSVGPSDLTKGVTIAAIEVSSIAMPPIIISWLPVRAPPIISPAPAPCIAMKPCSGRRILCCACPVRDSGNGSRRLGRGLPKRSCFRSLSSMIIACSMYLSRSDCHRFSIASASLTS